MLDRDIIRSAPCIHRIGNLEESLKLSPPGHVLEFGVWKGKSLRALSKVTGRLLWGFDSFEGLPEAWVRGPDTYQAGHFAINKIPKYLRAENIRLVQGFFEDTLETWLVSNPGEVGFLHIDCDLYSSTAFILSSLNGRIVPGTVIVFDELLPHNEEALAKYPNWEQGEWKALHEWMEECSREVEVISRGEDYSVTVKVTK